MKNIFVIILIISLIGFNNPQYAYAVNTNSADFTGGATQYLSRTDSSGSWAASYTIQFWAQVTTQPGTGVSFPLFDFTYQSATPFGALRMWYRDNAGTKEIYGYRDKTSVGTDVFQFSQTLTTDLWYHISFTWDGADLKTYINGSLANTTASSGTGNTNAANSTKIGGDGTTAFTGRLDDFRHWSVDRGLTQIAIDATCLVELVGDEANLVSYYTWNADLTTDDEENHTYTLTNNNSVTQSGTIPSACSSGGTVRQSEFFDE